MPSTTAISSTLERRTALAVFRPIVASTGGIGTTQTATVVIRGIALGDLTSGVVRRVLWKELWLGVTTGVVNGLPIAAFAYLWKQQLLLALILGVALLFNMLVAAVVDTLVPVALKILHIDPAIRLERHHHDLHRWVQFFPFWVWPPC